MVKSVFNLSRRICSLALLVCLGCAAQSGTPDLDHRIERQIRAQYDLPPKVSVVLGPKTPAADFPGYEEVPVTISLGDRKNEYHFLLSKDGKSLIRVTKMDLTKDPYADVENKIDIVGRPVRGNKDAKVTIVNFDDFQCPYCAMMHSELTQDILKTYGDKVKIVYKDFPLEEIHPWAKHAAINASCLAAQSSQAYWNFADEVHGHAREWSKGMTLEQQKDRLDLITIEQGQKAGVNMDTLQACVKAQKDDAVKASMSEAELLGLDSTPTMFVNGQKVSGVVPAEDLKAVINRALSDAGENVPPGAAQKSSGGGM
ncbi:MAG TPA: thioredoxin domain-containing protein [Terriglobales bacterium]|nr:thioredoxin domain-containing protein [Terriglobales bacterium]